MLAAAGYDNHVRAWDLDGIDEAKADRMHQYYGHDPPGPTKVPRT
jgi:hypothetical protein